MNLVSSSQLGPSIKSYPTATELALITGVEVADNVIIQRAAFHDDDLVLNSRSFWDRATRYIHVSNDRVVVPAVRAFADDLLTVGMDDAEWQHGAERLANLISVAIKGGYRNVCIAL